MLITAPAVSLTKGVPMHAHRRNVWSRMFAISAAAGVAISIAASTSSGAMAAPAHSNSWTLYTGIENGYPATLPAPKVKAGFHPLITDMVPCGCEPIFVTQRNAAAAEIKKLGGKFASMDANAQIPAQATELKTFISEKPSAMIVEPLDPTSLGPELKQAQAAKIPVVTRDTPPEGKTPLLPGYKMNILQGEDRAAFWLAQALAKAIPHGNVAILGIALPVASLTYRAQRQMYWLKHFGLHVLGEVQGASPAPSDSATAMQAILTKYPNVQGVMSWDDTSAEAAATVALAQHKKVLIEGDVGDPDAIADVRSGRLFADFQFPSHAMGKDEAIAAYDVATKQAVPKEIAPVGVLVLKSSDVEANGTVIPEH
jgi:ABC-type sugar transport system substrate-binding protein